MADEPSSPVALSAGDIRILECERALWGPQPNKESAVRERCGLSLARYYQRLYALCETQAAVDYDAVFVRQCLEAKFSRSRARKLGPTAGGGEHG